MTNDRHIQAR